MRTLFLLSVPFLLHSLAGSACAQTALGDGRALDANLSTTGGRINTQVRDLNSTIQQNNRIVTGQAGAGKSFRGSLGYQATNEFRGSIASDTNYTFRRDSASGTGVGGGIRSTDALRYQFNLIEGRPSADPFGAAPRTGQPGGGEVRGGGVGTGAAISTMRSVSQYQSRSAQLPVLLSYTNSPTDKATFAVTASPLRGIGVTPLGQSANNKTLGLTGLERPVYGVATVSEAFEQEEKEAKRKVASAPGAATPPAGGLIDQRLLPGVPAYDRVITSLTQSIDQRFVTTTPTTKPKVEGEPEAPVAKPGWLKELDDLRERLRKERLDTPRPSTTPGSSVDPTAKPGELNPLDPTTPIDPMLDAFKKMKPKIAELVAKQGIGPDPADSYTQRMRDGQDKLAAGRFFEAEGAFTIALLSKTNDPLAQAGRTNAQLGAGLFLSACKGLRDLLSDHPEMIPVRFGPELLPSSARAAELSAQLQGEATNPTGLLGADSGLLLAYLGFQFDQPSWVEDGLRILDRKTGPDEEGAKALATLLRGVWADSSK